MEGYDTMCVLCRYFRRVLLVHTYRETKSQEIIHNWVLCYVIHSSTLSKNVRTNGLLPVRIERMRQFLYR